MPDGAIRCRPGAPSSPIHVRCAFTGKIGAMWVDCCRVVVCFTCPQRPRNRSLHGPGPSVLVALRLLCEMFGACGCEILLHAYEDVSNL